MNSRDYRKLQSIVQKETRKQLAQNAAEFERMDKRMGLMQYQIDCLYGADPDELQIRERSSWKTYMTGRIKKNRENHPEETVRTDYRVIFGRLYDSLQRDYEVDLNTEKVAYMDRHSIPRTAYRNVRTLNVVYDKDEIRRYFEEEVEKFEDWFVKDNLERM